MLKTQADPGPKWLTETFFKRRLGTKIMIATLVTSIEKLNKIRAMEPQQCEVQAKLRTLDNAPKIRSDNRAMGIPGRRFIFFSCSCQQRTKAYKLFVSWSRYISCISSSLQCMPVFKTQKPTSQPFPKHNPTPTTYLQSNHPQSLNFSTTMCDMPLVDQFLKTQKQPQCVTCPW